MEKEWLGRGERERRLREKVGITTRGLGSFVGVHVAGTSCWGAWTALGGVQIHRRRSTGTDPAVVGGQTCSE